MLKIEQQIDSYIKRTIVNAVKDFKKYEERKNKKEVSLEEISNEINYAEIALLSVTDDYAIFSFDLENTIEDEKLFKIIKQLSKEEKEILTLSILEWTSKEIAEKISKSDSRVRHILTDVISKIRKKYNEE